MEKNVWMARLMDAYGCLLSDKRLSIMEQRYAEDLTLGEIAERLGITRQGVHEAIAAASQQLEGFEAKLGMVERDAHVREGLMRALAALEDSDTPCAADIIGELLGGGDDGV